MGPFPGGEPDLHPRQRLGTGHATVAFIAVWLVIAAGNMWGGVARAGYTLREELPIFALIFLLPAALAVIVKWQLL